MPHKWSKTSPTEKIRGTICYHFECQEPGCNTYKEYKTAKTRDMAARCHFKSAHKDLPYFHNSGINDVVDVVFRNAATPETTTRAHIVVPSPVYRNSNYNGQ